MGAKRANLRFHGDLEHIAKRARVECSFDVSPSVKDLIEGAGVPHTEIGAVEVDGEAVDLSHRVADAVTIDVHPALADVTSNLRPEPPAELRFVADANLGRLARHLRLLGFDVLYENDLTDEQAVEASVTENRVLLSRDVGVLKRRDVVHGCLVRADEADDQMLEVTRRYDLARSLKPFTRCPLCNGELEDVPKSSVRHLLAPSTVAHVDEYRKCLGCGHVYWKGAHHEGIQKLVTAVMHVG